MLGVRSQEFRIRLTPRETEVARLVAQALANKEIAAELGLSPQTVKNHLNNIFGKLGLHDRVSLALYVVKWEAVAEERVPIAERVQ
jgi:DNA-binding NarL/FixJ family response regulator